MVLFGALPREAFRPENLITFLPIGLFCNSWVVTIHINESIIFVLEEKGEKKKTSSRTTEREL